jgi:hypothetical protein
LREREKAFHFKRLNYLIQDVFHDPEKSGGFRCVEAWNEGREWFKTVYFVLYDIKPKEEG